MLELLLYLNLFTSWTLHILCSISHWQLRILAPLKNCHWGGGGGGQLPPPATWVSRLAHRSEGFPNRTHIGKSSHQNISNIRANCIVLSSCVEITFFFQGARSNLERYSLWKASIHSLSDRNFLGQKKLAFET